ncbi:phosphotransferase enzyme family protein [Tothia fuscella]|uniref:Phosphotransferase enzyme family protein n=1 Tax=Tothia fuscella TaxID=1048955 RepID=A0A9P4TV74_9PEZI|nr:phosphotransferase enzyme family protein [Tothia fuscella]
MSKEAVHARLFHRKRASLPDWNIHDDFFQFTRGTFVRNEAEQLASRRIKFDMNELTRVAASSIGANSCIMVENLPDGMYNKTFLLSMDDGQKVVAKVPNPNSGTPYFTTASEVATMDFPIYVRNTLKAPVPKVFKYECRSSNPVGAEFIIMEKVAGVQLGQLWSKMELVDKMRLRLDLSRLQSLWLSLKFNGYGALYYSRDLENPHRSVLYTQSSGEPISDRNFTIGPVTGRQWFDEGRGNLLLDRGPWKCVQNYYNAIGNREETAISVLTPAPKPTVMVCGPGIYQPRISDKLAAIDSYLKINNDLLPTEDSLISSHIWHNDLHAENIFVDPLDPTRITGIIDWQGMDLLPLIEHNIDPSFIEYTGPEPDTLEPPQLKDTNLEGAEKAAALKQYFDEALFIASRKITLKRLPSAYAATQFQHTDAFNLLILGRRLSEFGEAHFNSLVLSLREAWSTLPVVQASLPPREFPVSIDKARAQEIESSIERALLAIQLMNKVKARLGPLWPDKDAVAYEDYDRTKSALRESREEIVARFGKTEDEREELRRLWPFDD